MALELVYTSAERGLRPGSSGFCTVAMTKGLAPALVPRLEALGGYRPGPTGDGPVARSFWRIETASGIAHVLAVVGPAPPDHTQRTNKIAAYLVLSQDELDDAGPAWMLAQPGALRTAWSGAPAWLETPARAPAGGPAGLRRADAWHAACGDAGWAGALASAFLRDQGKPVHVIVPAHVDPLPLVDDAMHLLPPWARWRATFTTYFLQAVAGTPCAWRFCLEGSPAADQARQSKGLVIDLSRAIGEAPDSRFVRMARTGIDPEGEAEAARQAASRDARRARDAAAARAAADVPIDLEPAAPDDARPRTRTPVTPRGLPMDIGDPVAPGPAGVRKPVIVAAVAGVATIGAIGLILIASQCSGSGHEGGGGAPTTGATPEAAPPAARATAPRAATGERAAAPAAAAAPTSGAAPAPAQAAPSQADAQARDAQRRDAAGDGATAAASPDASRAEAVRTPGLAEPVTIGPASAPAPKPTAPAVIAQQFGEVRTFEDMGRSDAAWGAVQPSAAAAVRAPEFMRLSGIVFDDNGRLPVTGCSVSPLRLVPESRKAVLRALEKELPPKLENGLYDWIPGGATSARTPVEWLRAVQRRVLVVEPAADGEVLFQPTRPATAPILRGASVTVQDVPDPQVWVRVLGADAKPVAERHASRRRADAAVPGAPVAPEVLSLGGGRSLDVELDASRPAVRLAFRAPDPVDLQRRLAAAKGGRDDTLHTLSSLEACCRADRASDPDLRRVSEAMTDAEVAAVPAAGGAKTTQAKLAALNGAGRTACLAGMRARLAADVATADALIAGLDEAAKQSRSPKTDLHVQVLGMDGYVFVDAPLWNAKP